MLLPKYETAMLPLPGGAAIPFLRLGHGSIPLVVLPGAGDGMNHAVEAARRLAWYFRPRLGMYQILYISRRQPIPADYTMEQHARDCLAVLEHVGQPPSFVECNSAGGPVGQWLAVLRPDLVCGLILSVTLHRTDAHFRQVIGHWAELARQRKWAELNWSSVEYTFRPRTVRRARLLRPFLGMMGEPRDPDRVVRLFEELLVLDNSKVVSSIRRPTLVIGGADDRVINAELQREMALLIPRSKLILYPGYGHGNDQENPDYRVQLDQFVREHAQPEMVSA